MLCGESTLFSKELQNILWMSKCYIYRLPVNDTLGYFWSLIGTYWYFNACTYEERIRELFWGEYNWINQYLSYLYNQFFISFGYLFHSSHIYTITTWSVKSRQGVQGMFVVVWSCTNLCKTFWLLVLFILFSAHVL